MLGWQKLYIFTLDETRAATYVLLHEVPRLLNTS